MRSLRSFAFAALAAMLVAGCGASQIGQIIAVGVKNPINNTQLYQAEVAFDGTLKTFNELKGLCARRVLKPSCRTYVVQGQNFIRKAAAADVAARNFVDKNPTLDATNVVGAFTGIVSDFNRTTVALSATK